MPYILFIQIWKRLVANMHQILTLLGTAMKLITQTFMSLAQAMLPRTLSSINRYANESARRCSSFIRQI